MSNSILYLTFNFFPPARQIMGTMEGRQEGRKEDIFIQSTKQTWSGNNEELFICIKANYIVIQSS